MFFTLNDEINKKIKKEKMKNSDKNSLDDFWISQIQEMWQDAVADYCNNMSLKSAVPSLEGMNFLGSQTSIMPQDFKSLIDVKPSANLTSNYGFEIKSQRIEDMFNQSSINSKINPSLDFSQFLNNFYKDIEKYTNNEFMDIFLQNNKRRK